MLKAGVNMIIALLIILKQNEYKRKNFPNTFKRAVQRVKFKCKSTRAQPDMRMCNFLVIELQLPGQQRTHSCTLHQGGGENVKVASSLWLESVRHKSSR